MEKEQLFSNLKNHLIEKLAEKEVLIAQQNGQLEALKIEISFIRDRAFSDEGDTNTSYALLDHDLQQKNTRQRKRLNILAKEDEKLRAELRQHMVNLKMVRKHQRPDQRSSNTCFSSPIIEAAEAHGFILYEQVW